MSEVDKEAFWLSSQLSWFAHVTPEATDSTLCDFELPAKKSSEWLAAQIREALFRSIGTEEEIEDYPGKNALRKEISAIADAIGEARRHFAERSKHAESVLRQHSRYDGFGHQHNWHRPIHKQPDALDCLDCARSQEWVESSNYLEVGSTEWQRFRAMVCGMLELEEYLRAASAAQLSSTEPSRWRAAEKKKGRIRFAVNLATVFEEAYGREATVNNWADGSGDPILGPWPKFFNRIACLALKLDRVPDLSRLLKAARRERLKKQG